MKKVYLSILSFGLITALNAQKSVEMKKNHELQLNIPSANEKGNSTGEKAAGDVIWSNTMSNQTNWAASVVGGTQSANTGWQWSPTNTGGTSIGTWAFTSTKINSTTKTTGYYVAKNGNPSSGTPAVATGVELVLMFDSTFNLSTYSDVDFQFQEFGAAFIDNQVVEATIDGGTNWVEIGNNADLGELTASGGSNFSNPTNRSYHIMNAFPSGTDFSTIKFRFRIYWPSNSGANDGIMYGWFVDDVKLVEGNANDLVVNEAFNFVGTLGAQYTQLPATQAGTATAAFSANVKNAGSNAQDATLTITNPGAVGASAQTSVAGFSTDSLSYAGPYTLPTTVGTYNFVYTATSSNNTLANTTDDVLTIPFAITTATYACDAYNGTAGSTNGSFGGWSTMTGDQEIGNYFEIFNDGTIGAVKIGIASVSSSSQSTYIGQNITAKLYLYDSSTGSITDIVETESHTIIAGDFGQIITLHFSDQYPVSSGDLYVVTASSAQDNVIPVMFAGYQTYGYTVGVDNSGPTLFNLAPSSGNKVEAPVIRLDFTDYTGIKSIENNVNLSVYPNPFNNSTKVDFELANNSTCAIYVTDLAGRKVVDLGSDSKTAGKHSVEINGTSLEAGIYNVTININGTSITKRIVKK